MRASGATIRPSRLPAGSELLVVAAALLIGVAVRVHDLTADGLWMDEVWGATYAQLGLQDLLVAVARLDVHPPFYYMQLNVWAALFGKSDVALLANSVFWSIGTLIAVFATARRIFGPATAALAIVVAAVAGGEVYYTHEVRMYAMMAFLAVITWYCAHVYAEARTGRAAIVLVVVVAILAASHGASVVAVSCVAVYLLLRLGIRGVLSPRSIVIFVLMGVATLPWIVNSYFRGVSHTDPVDVQTVAETIGGWLLGYRTALDGPQAILACLVVAGAVASALTARRDLRDLVLAFVLWPVVFVLVFSILARPIWIPRLFDFCGPFVSIAVAAALLRAWKQAGRIANPLPRIGVAIAGGVLIIAMTVASFGQGAPGWKSQYREAAAFLASHAQPGDVIYMPEHTMFWGIARYFAGPDWGNALAVQDPVRPAKSTAWDGIYARLGREWLERLHLVPQTREIRARDVTLVIGWTPAETVAKASRVWLAGTGIVAPDSVALCDVASAVPTSFRGVTVYDIACRRS